MKTFQERWIALGITPGRIEKDLDHITRGSLRVRAFANSRQSFGSESTTIESYLTGREADRRMRNRLASDMKAVIKQMNNDHACASNCGDCVFCRCKAIADKLASERKTK